MLFAFIDMHGSIIILGIIAMILSHLVSFVENFILRGEIFKLTPSKLMGQPYGQILAMHAGLILGAITIEKLGSTIMLLTVMVVFKSAANAIQDQRRHKTIDAGLNIEH